MDAQERDEDEGGADCFAQAYWSRVSGVAVELGEQHAYHVDKEGETGQHRQADWYCQDPLSVTVIHPASATATSNGQRHQQIDVTVSLPNLPPPLVSS